MATLALVKDAILVLKDRTGSSSIAITKFIETERKVDIKKHLLKAALKKGVADGILIQNKNSYKLAPDAKKAKPAVKKVKLTATKKVNPKAKATTSESKAKTKNTPTKKAAAKPKASIKKPSAAATKKVAKPKAKPAVKKVTVSKAKSSGKVKQ